MATIAEVQERLDALTGEEFQKFQQAFGGEAQPRGWYLDVFVGDPARWERKLCQLLSLPTEAEKLVQVTAEATRAARTSAAAAVESARHARISVRIAEVAVIVSVVSVLISLLALAITVLRKAA